MQHVGLLSPLSFDLVVTSLLTSLQLSLESGSLIHSLSTKLLLDQVINLLELSDQFVFLIFIRGLVDLLLQGVSLGDLLLEGCKVVDIIKLGDFVLNFIVVGLQFLQIFTLLFADLTLMLHTSSFFFPTFALHLVLDALIFSKFFEKLLLENIIVAFLVETRQGFNNLLLVLTSLLDLEVLLTLDLFELLVASKFSTGLQFGSPRL